MQHSFSPSSSRVLSICLSALVLGLLVGCDALTGVENSPASPYPLQMADSTILDPGIKVALRTPDTVALGDPFRIQARIDNQNDDTVHVVTGTPALYDVAVYDGSESLPLEGTNTLLPQVVTEHDLPPSELVREPQFRAARFSDKEAPITPGTYTNRLTLNWKSDGTRIQDTLETTMVFQNE